MGFLILQADIASALLIRAGVQVTVFNQRSVDEIFSMLWQVAAMVGQGDAGLAWMAQTRAQLLAIQEAAKALPRRPRVFFEEWDEPHISAIRWVSELLGVAGGDDCFEELSRESLGKIASLPAAPRSWRASLTSSSVRGVARNFGQKKWRRGRVGKTYQR